MKNCIANCQVHLKALLAFSCLCLFVSSASFADEAHPAAEAGEHESHGASEAEHGDADHGDAKHGDAHDAHGDGGHETGIPLSFKSDLALWSLVTFLAFLFVLKTFAWGPMIQGLDLREAGIRKSIEEAEENRRKSQALLADYEQKLKDAERTVQAMVAEAKRDAERTSQDLIAAAQNETAAMRDRARDDINQARDAALSELFTAVNSQVLAATEHVLGRAITAEDQERLVSEALSGISR
ncbi:MAG: F0F1 ATP synthase subunit B [Planctomycetaceae bacterium]